MKCYHNKKSYIVSEKYFHVSDFPRAFIKKHIIRYYPWYFSIQRQRQTCKGKQHQNENGSKVINFNFQLTFLPLLPKNKSEREMFTRLILHFHVFITQMFLIAENSERIIKFEALWFDSLFAEWLITLASFFPPPSKSSINEEEDLQRIWFYE